MTGAYVFDVDGTLVTFPVEWDRVRKELRSITKTDLEFKPVFPAVEEVITKNPEYREPIFAAIDRYELAALGGVQLQDGAYEALSQLSKGAKLSLVTLQGRRALTQILERFGLAGFFGSRFTREDSTNRAVQLRMALGALGLPKEEVVFVADRINDLIAAREVGVQFVMVRPQGAETGAETVFTSMREFYRVWVSAPGRRGSSPGARG